MQYYNVLIYVRLHIVYFPCLHNDYYYYSYCSVSGIFFMTFKFLCSPLFMYTTYMCVCVCWPWSFQDNSHSGSLSFSMCRIALWQEAAWNHKRVLKHLSWTPGISNANPCLWTARIICSFLPKGSVKKGIITDPLIPLNGCSPLLPTAATQDSSWASRKVPVLITSGC